MTLIGHRPPAASDATSSGPSMPVKLSLPFGELLDNFGGHRPLHSSARVASAVMRHAGGLRPSLTPEGIPSFLFHPFSKKPVRKSGTAPIAKDTPHTVVAEPADDLGTSSLGDEPERIALVARPTKKP